MIKVNPILWILQSDKTRGFIPCRWISTKLITLLFVLILHVSVSVSEITIFQNTEFYYNLSQDLDAASSERITEILNKGVIDLWKDPRYLKSFKMIDESSMLSDIIKYQKIISTIIHLNILTKVNDKRYFYMRESIRRVARASIDTSVEKAVTKLVDSDLIAVFIDPQFRAMVSPLVESGYLEKYFSIVADLNYFENDVEFKSKWDDLYQRYLKVNYNSDAKVISLMEIVESSSEEVKNMARNVRDSGFYEVKLSPKQMASLKSPLYAVYDGYVRDEKWAKSIQVLTKKKLFFKAIQDGEQKVQRYFERVLRKKAAKKKALVEEFLSSKLFKQFLGASSSSIYLFLLEEGILKEFVNNLDEIEYLLQTSKSPQFKKNELSMSLKKKKLGKQRQLRKKRERDFGNCYENMSRMMAVREKYSRKMRKEVYIKSVEDRIEFFEKTGLKIQICPTGGKYLSSKFGRIQCTYHGDAPIIKIESSK
ncbi:MAG: hypothetical protein KC646_17290 [Candidatus Cloacimonetes bacterium]|nr:hypothetical protein [Candidatus Cloacimonadota bacterium]